MKFRQVRIFAPNDAPHEWSDKMVAFLWTPVVTKEPPDWFWFTRYHAENEVDPNDCKWSEIPRAYKSYSNKLTYTTRSMRFRWEPKKGSNTEKLLKALIDEEQYYWYSDFRDYDAIADLNSYSMMKACEYISRVAMECVCTGELSASGFRMFEQLHHRLCNTLHITDYRKLGKDLVTRVLSDYDNLRYDSPHRKEMWDHK